MMDMEPKLPLHKVVPLFTLPDKHGEAQNLARQRGRQHLLLLMFRGDVDPQAYLHNLAKYNDEWRQLPARGVVVVRSEDAAGVLGPLPFTILIDRSGQAGDRFLPDGAQVGVFALDRYGDLYQQWLGVSVGDLPSAVDIHAWMQAISMQCSI
jgi:hypothetical protein